MEKQKKESKKMKKIGGDGIYQNIYIGGYNGH